MDLNNKLLAIGKVVPNKFVCQFVFNGLPRSYKGVVQTLSNLDTIFTFDHLTTRLMVEATCQKQWTSQLGNEKTLAIDFNHVTTLQPRGFITARQLRGQFPIKTMFVHMVFLKEKDDNF